MVLLRGGPPWFKPGVWLDSDFPSLPCGVGLHEEETVFLHAPLVAALRIPSYVTVQDNVTEE